MKIAGGLGRDAWITRKAYGIALSAENTSLLDRLNEGIGRAHEDGTIERLTRAWLIPEETIAAGERKNERLGPMKAKRDSFT